MMLRQHDVGFVLRAAHVHGLVLDQALDDGAVDMMDNARALPTCPLRQQQQQQAFAG
jgi:hypothetical protein